MGLDGTWVNELKSTFVIEPVQGGALVGTYETLVSGDACAKGQFIASGRTDVDSRGSSVAWSVSWTNQESSCASVTAWAGQYDGKDTIVAFWLLSRKTSPDDAWAATTIGMDTFVRQGSETEPPPTHALIQPSHP